MTRDAFVASLEGFAAQNHLPVETGTAVTDLARDEVRGAYRLDTPSGPMWAHNVVIASGSLNRPRRPPAAAALPPRLVQFDAAAYRNPAALPAGAVLVVGSAQCGGQIAEDLVETGRTVFLATGRVGRFPRRYRGYDTILWLVRSGLFDVPRKDFVEASGHILARPLLGAGHTISLQSLSALGVVLLGRFTRVEDGGARLSFADDLQDHVRFGDESSAIFKRHIDDYIAREGLDAPAAEVDPAEAVAPHLSDPPIRSLDPAERDIAAVIWCTGFEGDFQWVRLPGVLNAQAQPVHEAGIAPLPGIYFAGLDFASTRKSGTLLAVEEESRFLVAHLLAHRR
jgi:putative flavoprotein involved in K+ transport